MCIAYTSGNNPIKMDVLKLMKEVKVFNLMMDHDVRNFFVVGRFIPKLVMENVY